MTMLRAKAAPPELAHVDGLIQQAIDLWDAGFCKVWEDYPGLVAKYGENAEQKIVPLEVWTYLRGIKFGLGTAHMLQKTDKVQQALALLDGQYQAMQVEANRRNSARDYYGDDNTPETVNSALCNARRLLQEAMRGL